MQSEYLAKDVVDSSDEDPFERQVANGLSIPSRARTVTLPATDNVWKRCPLPAKGDQIRLLKLYPPSRRYENNLEANLIIRKGNEKYEALSYTWSSEGEKGSEGVKGSIRVQSGGGEFEEIEIQQNLESALRQLRRPLTSRLLWIDAICIDQHNLEEKNHQVPKMATIYNDARSVCVWLGKGTESTEKALSFVKQILDLDNFDRLVADSKSVKDWAALWELMNSPWFSRRWVIQEIALARKAKVYCGKAKPVKWRDFANAVALFGSRYHQIRELFKASAEFGHHFYHLGDVTALGAHRLVDESSNLFRKSDDGAIQEHLYSLEHLVSTLSPFQATNPRDTIYAVLSLAEDTGAIFSARPSAHIPVDAAIPGDNTQQFSETDKKKLQTVMSVWRKQVEKPYPVDYDKSFFEVCKDFLEFTIESSQSLDMICRPWAPTPLTKDETLPSWIPTVRGAPYRPGANRYHNRVNADNLVGVPSTGKRNYNAARKYPLKKTWRIGKSGTPEDKSLFVSGFILGSINDKALPAQQGNIPASWLRLAGWKNGDGPPPNAFWRTIVADRGPNGGNPPPYYQVACQQAFDQRATDDDLNTERLMLMNSSIKPGSEKVVTEYLRRVQSVVWMRVLIRTTIGESHNNLGLAPQSVREEDLICIVYGCSVPVVLRKIFIDEENGTYYYELIGECYIHGMMDGEAFRILQEMKIDKQEFELR
jgi:hypothetical protein